MAKKKKGRADGLKVVTFTFNGKKYFAYGHTKAEAKDKADQKLKDLKTGLFKKSKDMTFSEYYARWEEARTGTVKETTIRKQSFEAAAAVAVIIDKAGTTFGDLLLSDIEVQHIRILQKKLQTGIRKTKDGPKEYTRTTNTINDIMAFVSHIFHDAVNERAIDWNPCNGVKPLKRVEKPARETIHRALTKEETKAFMDAAKGLTEPCKTESVYYGLYRFLLATGCRVGEAAALTISDIKPDGVHITKTVTKAVDGSYIIGDTPKTDHGKRVIPMTDAIRDAISYQKGINGALYGNKVTRLDETIFKTSWGNLLIASNVERDIERICKKAGIERFTAHALRATFATRAIESGMNPKTLQEILGHADIGVTMNVYAHAMDETKAAEMQNVIAL